MNYLKVYTFIFLTIIKAILILFLIGRTIWGFVKHYKEPEAGYLRKTGNIFLKVFGTLFIITIIEFIVGFYMES